MKNQIVKRPLAYTFFIVFLVLTSCRQDVQTKNPPQSQINIAFQKEGELILLEDDQVLNKLDIEFALTEYDRQKGLMDRDSLGPNQGMLFVHPDDQVGELGYWMKNTRIPLDIIYVSEDSVVVSISENAQPYDLYGVKRSEGPAKYVLEVNGGKSKEWGIEPGKTKLRWEAINK